jgi:arylsulfatase A-like enzyme
MDAQLGRLLDVLKRRGTTHYVVVAGDHGEGLGEHGEAGHGVFVYQATQRVPLIVTGPGIAPGTTVTSNVGLVDVAPTILDLVKLAALDDADGRSLVPLIRGARPAPPDYEMETLYPSLAYGWAPLRALSAGAYKYIAAPRPELYELPTDPRETRDLLQPKAARAAARAAEIAGALDKLTRDDTRIVATNDAASGGDRPERRRQAPGRSRCREARGPIGRPEGRDGAPDASAREESRKRVRPPRARAGAVGRRTLG